MTVLKWGIEFGAGWSFLFWLISWTLMAMGKGEDLAGVVRVLYRGYSLTPRGIVLGTFWAFLDGFITGIIVGAVYSALRS